MGRQREPCVVGVTVSGILSGRVKLGSGNCGDGLGTLIMRMERDSGN